MKRAISFLNSLKTLCFLFFITQISCTSPHEKALSTLEEGIKTYKNGRFEEAYKKFQTANNLEIQANTPDTATLSKIEKHLAYASFSCTMLDSSLRHTKKYLSFEIETDSSKNIFDAFYLLDKIFEKYGEQDSCLLYLDSSESFAGKFKNKTEMAKIHIRKAEIYLNHGENNIAINHLEIAETISMEISSENLYTDAKEVYVDYLVSSKKFDEAFSILEDILQNNPADNNKIKLLAYRELGSLYYLLGNTDSCFSNYSKLLTLADSVGSISEKLESRRLIEHIYSDLGLNDMQEQVLLEAVEISKESMVIDEKADAWRDLGMCYLDKKELNKAQAAIDSAIFYYELMNQDLSIVIISNEIGYIYYQMQEYEKALEAFELCLKINTKTGSDTMIYMNNIAGAYYNMGDFSKAANMFKRILNSYENEMEAFSKIKILHNTAVVFRKAQLTVESEKYFLEAIKNIRNIEEKTEKPLRKQLLSNLPGSYSNLIDLYAEQERFIESIILSEHNKSRTMLNWLSGKETENINIPEFQHKLDDNQAILYFSAWGIASPHIFLISNENIKHKKLVKDEILANILANRSTDFENYLKEKLNPAIYGLIQKDEKIRSQHHQELFNCLFSYFKRLNTKNFSSNSWNEERVSFSKKLFDNFINPYIKELSGFSQLIIVPEAEINLIPFEILQDYKNDFLVSNIDISYIPSLRILNLLKLNNDTFFTKDILIFSNPTYMVNKHKTEEKIEIAKLRKSIYEGNSEVDFSKVYSGIGYQNFIELRENLIYETLKNKGINCDYFVEESVQEYKLKHMSEKNELLKYRIIHFSTHGLSIPEAPELNALVFSLPSANKNEDGYLRISEIMKLKVNAELVNLSACGTAEGKIYGTEGTDNLSNSFLIAGASGVYSSLWNLPDKATAEFNNIIYRKIFTEKLSPREAINSTKREFISGKISDHYKHPFYWAGIIYTGI